MRNARISVAAAMLALGVVDSTVAWGPSPRQLTDEEQEFIKRRPLNARGMWVKRFARGLTEQEREFVDAENKEIKNVRSF